MAWMALNPGESLSAIERCSSVNRIRRSAVYCDSTGGGTGLATSQLAGVRLDGSCAISSNKMVVPVRKDRKY